MICIVYHKQVSDDSHQFPSVVFHLYSIAVAAALTARVCCSGLRPYTCYPASHVLRFPKRNSSPGITHAAILVCSFEELPHSREKRLLASSCPSVRLSACTSVAAIGRISVNFDSVDFYVNLSIKPKLKPHIYWPGNFKINLPEIFSVRTAQ
jgi:hypothetical protein